ncbi:peptide deformylase [Gulosibacter sp. 10]|uniref:peptide deformylase n=1 Tax=Gulosibacter sp. 10 TaxID=1255570 RepID=UPI00097E7DDB|nr:peptide deformylase [Gulosibacter sp. 10]SJM65408.1 Peptide deformylase [Gulosibacter sp. 10]
MAVRNIRYYGDPVLRTPCDPIAEIDDSVRTLIQDLLDTTDMEGRAGVAAPQIGVGLRAFSWHIDGRTGYMINPVLEEVSGEPEEIDEGCLSVPGLWFKTKRYPYARARGIDLDGEEIVLEGEGLMAQMIQHECGHLDGTVFVDTLAKDERRAAMRQIRESDWF